ncbi:cytochrome c-type biogenesis protein [Azospirillum griseum]|uniref:Cytochrome c-type biogenesis protein n=1 Tax=Azospirillum griseum TaxID=2496639 RepID=A0A431VJ54_9PROT|nr:cytochrome c-type biogenesis protein [Azospirillum griseum]RTR21924.1 cytochrome c-type biogenesis protein CcmH [Azospirillum griseum]
MRTIARACALSLALGLTPLALTSLVLPVGPAWAVQPDEVLADPALEARARDISKDLRCLVCQNQSIDDSNAPLARDLRVLVRERLKAGDSDAGVMTYVTDRYGDYVLLRPPFKATTLVLWVAPFAILLLGGLATALFLRGRRGATAEADTAPLTEDERRRLDALLRKDDL